MAVDRDFIKQYLLKINYWWRSDHQIKTEDVGKLRPTYLESIKETLGLERIVCLSGVRRCGKSTLLFQLIQHLISDGVEPRMIVMIKIDDIIDKFEKIDDIVSVYRELTDVDPSREEVYFLLDELHFLEGWHLQLKHFIDFKYKCRFVVTGSSKTLMYKNASESLVGRIRFIDVFPLSFCEFLMFTGLDLPDLENIKETYQVLNLKMESIAHGLIEYLTVGGFPEWFKIKDEQRWARILLDDYLSLILYKDIVHVFKIKDPLMLEHLVRDIAFFSTERFSYTKLAQRLDSDRETVKLYLYYLQSSGLINIGEIYGKKKKSRERAQKKLFFREEGMRKAITLDVNEPRSIENMVAEHLTRCGMENKPFFKAYYWKNSREVDFILDTGREVIPFEVKYQTDPKDVAGLLSFMDRFGIEHGVMVTRDVHDSKEYTDKTIRFVPAWYFLLMDPRALVD